MRYKCMIKNLWTYLKSVNYLQLNGDFNVYKPGC